jgi:hypothetical protein
VKLYYVRDGRVLCEVCLSLGELRPTEPATREQLACMRCCATLYDPPPLVA